MSPTADWTDRLTMDDMRVEVEHAEALHFEDAFSEALERAEAVLGVGRQRIAISGEDDRCLLPARGYAFTARADGVGAVQITATPAGGGISLTRFTTAVAARYTHAIGTWDALAEDAADLFTGEAAAVAAARERSWGSGGDHVVYALAGYDTVIALARRGTVYRPTHE